MTTPIRERTFESDEKLKLPKPFIFRRLHSFLGLWLVLYLFEHLLVNSQAALFFRDEGYAFVAAVNKINALPYLRVIEVLLLGLPFLIHGVWGIFYALTGKLNAHKTNGTKPSLPQYKRNRAYSWQRITAWLLVAGILAHVIQMRFLDYPAHFIGDEEQHFMVRVSQDPGLPLVAQKLHVQLVDAEKISQRRQVLIQDEARLGAEGKQEGDAYYSLLDQLEIERAWLQAITQKPLRKNEVIAAAPSAGAAIFLTVRETFKSPLMVILYSLLVLGATFHAFNGLWTAMIKWGITLTRRSQKNMRRLSSLLMVIVTLMGLAAIWGTYWTVQFQT